MRAWPETDFAVARVTDSLPLTFTAKAWLDDDKKMDGPTFTLQSHEFTARTVCNGVDPVFENKLRPISLTQGRWPNADDEIAIDEATEAWGWRGIASLDDPAPTTLQVKLADVEKELFAAIDWSFKETLNCLSDTARQQAEERAAQLRRELAAITREMSSESLASYYRRILPLLFTRDVIVAADRKSVV